MVQRCSVFIMFVLLLMGANSSFAQGSHSEKEKVLLLCEHYFGKSFDKTLNLFEVNTSYVLHAIFDRYQQVEKLEVVPKYYFVGDHPDWKESDDPAYLSQTEYQNVSTKVDLLKPHGQLIGPKSSIGIVTNMTAWYTWKYVNATLTLGVRAWLPDGTPTEIKWFRVEFGTPLKSAQILD